MGGLESLYDAPEPIDMQQICECGHPRYDHSFEAVCLIKDCPCKEFVRK
jgi:hypothetical protein